VNCVEKFCGVGLNKSAATSTAATPTAAAASLLEPPSPSQSDPPPEHLKSAGVGAPFTTVLPELSGSDCTSPRTQRAYQLLAKFRWCSLLLSCFRTQREAPQE